MIAPTWNNEFELLDGSYSVSEIHDNFRYIIKQHEVLSDNPPIYIYINRIKIKRWIYQHKRGYNLELETPDTMKLLGSTHKKKIDETKNEKNVPSLDVIEEVLV